MDNLPGIENPCTYITDYIQGGKGYYGLYCSLAEDERRARHSISAERQQYEIEEYLWSMDGLIDSVEDLRINQSDWSLAQK